jgi:SAM-dependent methyltransferase
VRTRGDELGQEVIPCKICDADAPLHGVVDFNKTCEALKGRFFPLSGRPVYYRKCVGCGFLFTTEFDRWTPDDWRREVYNDGYADVDPENWGPRAYGNAPYVIKFARRHEVGRVMDYGGGNGALARLLREAGLDAVSWDILTDGDPPERGTFDLVTAFEVIEHSATPKQTARDILSFLRPGGTVLLSTLTVDGLPPQSCDLWYIAPRNGHVSIYTRAALARLFGDLGCDVEHINDVVHVVRGR